MPIMLGWGSSANVSDRNRYFGFSVRPVLAQ